MSTADAIARVITDLRRGQVFPAVEDSRLWKVYLDVAGHGPVVDVTPIFMTQVLHLRRFNVYDDYPCVAPPWPVAQFAWENTFGNIYVMSLNAAEVNGHPHHRWETHEPIRWEEVRWVLDGFLTMGGYSQTDAGPVRTFGPLYLWEIAVAADGRPLDVHWVDLFYDVAPEHSARLQEQGLYDNAILTVMAALRFLNCRNIEAVEPKRERHERRRLERAGVKIQTLVVYPVGRRGGRKASAIDLSAGTALTSVRGHFACYGPEYGRGLLFGRHSGRYWIPAHARGSPEEGVNLNDYRLQT